MGDIGAVVLERIEREDALPLLQKYYGGDYTGSMYDELASDDPFRVTVQDVAALACLSVPLSGPAVAALLRDHAGPVAELLREIPPGSDLVHVTSEDELEPLWALQKYFAAHVRNVEVGPVRRSKLLAHKRPHLVPIRDRHVLHALVGGDRPLTIPLWHALQWNGGAVVERLANLRGRAGLGHLSLLRVLDVIIWMQEWGDAQVDPALCQA